LTSKKKRNELLSLNSDAIVLPATYDSAMIGYVDAFQESVIAVYSVNKVLEALSNELGKEYDDEDVAEYFTYNIKGSYLGEFTPLFLYEWEE
jgi:adenine-specific DNA methylase